MWLLQVFIDIYFVRKVYHKWPRYTFTLSMMVIYYFHILLFSYVFPTWHYSAPMCMFLSLSSLYLEVFFFFYRDMPLKFPHLPDLRSFMCWTATVILYPLTVLLCLLLYSDIVFIFLVKRLNLCNCYTSYHPRFPLRFLML